jgi:methylated-DNA-[protein]-cysteine S-methyltransferase
MRMTSHWTVYESPLGPLTLRGGPRGLTGLDFPGRGDARDEGAHDPAAFAEPLRQLEEYFTGRRQRFDLALDLGGTPFQRAVWARLLAIPYGATTTYGALAAALGRPDRAPVPGRAGRVAAVSGDPVGLRAVGAAVGRTPVPIVVPCHRVLGADGALTGYGGGLHRKQALLDLERRGATGRAPEPAWAFRQIALL